MKAWNLSPGFHESCVRSHICCILLYWMKSGSHQRSVSFLKDSRSEAKSTSLWKSRMISDACRAISRQRSSVSFKNLSQMSIDTLAAPLPQFGLRGTRLRFISKLQTKAKEYRSKNNGQWKPEPRW